MKRKRRNDPPGPSPYGVALLLYRTRQGHVMSQKDLAEKTGNRVTVDEIANLETGRVAIPHPQTHALLADALDLDVDERTIFNGIFQQLYRERHPSRTDYLQLPDARQPGHDMHIFGPWILPVEKALGLILLAVLIASAVVTLVHQVAPQAGLRSTSVVPELPPPALGLAGFVVDAAQVGNGERGLVVTNLRTRDTAQLLPFSFSSSDSDQQAQVASWIAPAYSPVTNKLAAIGIDLHGLRSLWESTVQFTPDGGMSLVPGSLQQLVADCGICNTSVFTPEGNQIIYETAHGLQAVDLNTRTVRQVTSGADDAWPACSPDGQWIAYQHDVQHSGDTLLVPSNDCMPAGPAFPVAGFSITWHPAFSPDSSLLAFTGTPGGSGQPHYRIFEVRLPTGTTTTSMFAVPAATAVSNSGCFDPTWATERSGRQMLLIYACGTQLEAQPGGLHPAWHEPINAPGDLGPALYNPIWIPGPST